MANGRKSRRKVPDRHKNCEKRQLQVSKQEDKWIEVEIGTWRARRRSPVADIKLAPPREGQCWQEKLRVWVHGVVVDGFLQWIDHAKATQWWGRRSKTLSSEKVDRKSS